MSARLGSKVHVDRSGHDVIDCSLTLSHCRLQIVVYSMLGMPMTIQMKHYGLNTNFAAFYIGVHYYSQIESIIKHIINLIYSKYAHYLHFIFL